MPFFTSKGKIEDERFPVRLAMQQHYEERHNLRSRRSLTEIDVVCIVSTEPETKKCQD